MLKQLSVIEMKKGTKISLISIGFILITIIILILNGFRLMAIEDYYGDNQDIYFKSRNGDLIINRDFREVGHLEKDLTRIRIVNSVKNIDLLYWSYEDKVEVYRPESNIENISDLTFNEVEKLIKAKNLKLIAKN